MRRCSNLILAVGSLLSIAATAPGRLEIPGTHPVVGNVATGLQHLGGGMGEGLYFVPKSYRADEPLPLLILLHGGFGYPWHWFGSYSRRAEAGRFIIVAPKSYGKTWARSDHFGPDIAIINQSIAFVCSRYAIDRNRVLIGGISDGASYALSLGLANGDQVRGAIAFSPGYIVAREGLGHPSFFISHGLRDTELPITQTRAFVALLRKFGYSVEYWEFSGGHEAPQFISDAAIAWAQALFKSRK